MKPSLNWLDRILALLCGMLIGVGLRVLTAPPAPPPASPAQVTANAPEPAPAGAPTAATGEPAIGPSHAQANQQRCAAHPIKMPCLTEP